MLSFSAEAQNDCPLGALYKYDRDHDDLVSRAEWREFICEGCVADSVCLTRSCGDGSIDGGKGCRFGFDDLDVSFRMSPFYVAKVNYTANDVPSATARSYATGWLGGLPAPCHGAALPCLPHS